MKSSVILIAVLSLSLQAAAQDTDWKLVNSPGCGFTIMMPGEVQVAADTIQVGSGLIGVEHSYDSGIYDVTCFVYPRQFIDRVGSEHLIEEWLRVWSQGLKLKLEDVSEVWVGEYFGRRFKGIDTIGAEEPLYYVDGRIYKIDDKLIVMTVQSLWEAGNAEDIARFLESIRIN